MIRAAKRAQERQQWAQEQEHLLRDLTITAEYDDAYGLGVALHSLARLRQAYEDAGPPAAVGAVLDISPQEAEELLRAATQGDGKQSRTEVDP